MTDDRGYPNSKVELRAYLADCIRDHEPGVTLDEIVSAFWPLYEALRTQIPLPQGDDE